MATTIVNLVEQASQGNRVALERLLMLFDLRLRRRIGRRLAKNSPAVLSVDDVLQETYTDAFRHIRRLEPRGGEAFYNWLAAIAERKLLDAVRALRTAKRSPPPGARRVASDRGTSLLGLAQLVDPRNKTPSGVVAREEAVKTLQVALARLPEPCRQVVWMHHVENKPAREIAAALGRTERAVNQLCYRGLQQLREEMGSRSRYLGDSR